MVAGQRRVALATMLVMMMTPRVESDAGADSRWTETLNVMLVMMAATSRQRRALRSVEDDTATDDGRAGRRGAALKAMLVMLVHGLSRAALVS